MVWAGQTKSINGTRGQIFSQWGGFFFSIVGLKLKDKKRLKYTKSEQEKQKKK